MQVNVDQTAISTAASVAVRMTAGQTAVGPRVFAIALSSRRTKATAPGRAGSAAVKTIAETETAASGPLETTTKAGAPATSLDDRAMSIDRATAVAMPVVNSPATVLGNVTSAIGNSSMTNINRGRKAHGTATTAAEAAITAIGRDAGKMAIALWPPETFATIGIVTGTAIATATIIRSTAVGSITVGTAIVGGIIGTTGIAGRATIIARGTGGVGRRRRT